jgi:hypothetical protein
MMRTPEPKDVAKQRKMMMKRIQFGESINTNQATSMGESS